MYLHPQFWACFQLALVLHVICGWLTTSQTSNEFCNYCVYQAICEATGGTADSALSSLWGIPVVKNSASLLSFIFNFSSVSFEFLRISERNRPTNVSVGETEQLGCNCMKRHQEAHQSFILMR